MAAAACALSGTFANAARLVYEPLSSPTGVYSFYLYGEATTFNAAAFSVKPAGGAQFQNLNSGLVAGAPRPPGQSFTYRNRMLDVDPGDFPESKAWTLLGVVNTTSEIAFSGGPLGSTINTSFEPDGRLFLANIKLPPGVDAEWSIQLVNGGDTVYQMTSCLGLCPEPASSAIAGLGALAFVFARRRKN
jgi:hypothetical protein